MAAPRDTVNLTSVSGIQEIPSVPSPGNDTRSWWVLIPKEDVGKPADFLESVDFRLDFKPGTHEYAALKARKPIQWAGMTLVYWKGPFATEAQAEKSQNPKPSPNPASNLVGGIEGIGDFFARLTEANTWLRVGEFAVGSIMLYIGLKQLFPQAVQTVTAPVKKVAKIAAFIPK